MVEWINSFGVTTVCIFLRPERIVWGTSVLDPNIACLDNFVLSSNTVNTVDLDIYCQTSFRNHMEKYDISVYTFITSTNSTALRKR